MAKARHSGARRASSRRPNRSQGPPGTATLRPDAPSAFVIMPFGLVFDLIYAQLFRPMLIRAGYTVTRADTLLTQRAIMRDVIKSIQGADLILADLTGGNPNVFYELGIAHALRRKTVLVAQRREDVPFDLRGYKNYAYRVEFTDPPNFVDDLSPELEPFLDPARAGEVLWGNPFTDFSDPGGETSESAEEEGGILDHLRELNRRSDDYVAALEEASRITTVFNSIQEEMTARLSNVPEGTDNLDHVLDVAKEIAHLWDETATALETVLNEKITPLTLIMERGAKAAIDMARLGQASEETASAVSSLKVMSVQAKDASASMAGVAVVIRQNLGWIGALRRPGERLAAMYDRYATNFDRMAAFGDA